MAGRVEEAAGHYEELLRLNPGDNQGIRYTLMELYLERGRYQDAWRLLELYGEDPTAGWLYIRALLTFQREGPSAAAERALSEAMDSNPFVPEYLLRIRRLPREQPRLIGFGDEGEAIAYVGTHLNFWYQIPGAAGWLREAWDAR
jgi:tetratricopeptide (TPR) repeat protein